MSVRPLLSRLQGVIDRGNRRWYARCPAHDDRSPSLSIAETGDRVLIHCFAGCAAQDVLDALDLKWKDLYPDPWKASYRAATANRGRKFTERLLRNFDPLEIERLVLRIAAADLRSGKRLSAEDRARVEIAKMRLNAAKEQAA